MSARRRPTPRDDRRRQLGQNFLSESAAGKLVDAAGISPGELIVEIGAGRGSLTIPLAESGARVVAIERDPVWANSLRRRLAEAQLADRVRVFSADFRNVALPLERYRVVANPPFALTTAAFAHLLDRPDRGPYRADLLVQHEVARKRTAAPPDTLRSAAWAPWWTFRMGLRIGRADFRPVPAVDAAVVIVERRDPPILPVWMAPDLRESLRGIWMESSQNSV